MGQLKQFKENELCESTGLYAGISSNGKIVGSAIKVRRGEQFSKPPNGAVAWVLHQPGPIWNIKHLLGLSVGIAIVIYV